MPRPSVLVTLADRPWPADGGKRMRAAAVLRALAALQVDVDVLVVMSRGATARPVPPGVRVRRFAFADPPLRHPLRAAAAVAIGRVPWQIGVVDWQQIRAMAAPWSARPYDLVWFGATDHALELTGAVRAARTVIDVDDVETAKTEAFLALPAGAPTAQPWVRLQRRVELPLWRSVLRRVRATTDALVVCSELDRSRLGANAQVHVVPNGYPTGPDVLPRPPAERTDVLLIGTYSYGPNVDAAVFAAREVLPQLRRRAPEARLRVVGRGTEALPADLPGLPGVDVVGPVADVEPELARAAVALVPVRYGGGTRIKVLEAFAHGVPVVSTSLGCEGLDAVGGRHLLVQDDAAGLAEACARLLSDAGLAADLAAAGRQLLVDRFTDERVREAVHRVVLPLLPASLHA